MDERRNPWLALDGATDPVERARELRRAHADWVGGAVAAPAAPVRTLIADSWRRSAGAGVRPEGHVAPRLHDDRDLQEMRAAHPLARMMPTLRGLLLDVARQLHHLLVVCSADGELLWVEGPARVRVLAEDRMNFAEGTLWSEAGAGTNALGTALAVRHPVQVFAAEHFSASVHPWTCAASPIFEPRNGRLLGTIDLTGPFRMAHPHSLALVTAAAGAASGSLHQELWRDDERLRDLYVRRSTRLGRGPTGVVDRDGRVVMADPIGWLGTHVPIPGEGGVGFLRGGATFRAEPVGDGLGYIVWAVSAGAPAPRPALRLRLRGRATASLDGVALHLSPRHAEILAVLAAAPGGMSADELGAALYGPGATATTVRGEISRLRRLLGPVLGTRPYRLVADIDADLEADDPDAPELLPGSTAPGVIALRGAPAR